VSLGFVTVIMKDGPATITARHDVVDRTGELQARRPEHRSGSFRGGKANQRWLCYPTENRKPSLPPAKSPVQCPTIRTRLFKIGALIRVTTRRVWTQFSSSYPYRELFGQVLSNLRRAAEKFSNASPECQNGPLPVTIRQAWRLRDRADLRCGRKTEKIEATAEPIGSEYAPAVANRPFRRLKRRETPSRRDEAHRRGPHISVRSNHEHCHSAKRRSAAFARHIFRSDEKCGLAARCGFR
jgi:hypothetical protein